MLVIRYITAEDVRAFKGELPPEWNIGKPVGYAAERDGELIAIGSVTWDDQGRCWGWFNRRGHVPAYTMHRCAMRMLERLREVEEPALYAICNLAIPGAEKWLRRLGFVLDADLKHELGPVYRCDLI